MAENKKITDYTRVADTGGAEFFEVVKGSGNFKRLNNMTASAAPTAAADSAVGYSVGSFWYYNGILYVCKDSTEGAAVWGKVTVAPRSTDGSIDIDLTDPSAPDLSIGYQSYVALLTQSGTDAPTATVLENNTGLTFTPSYDDVGLYFLEPDTAPASDKVAVFCTNGAAAGDVFALWREDKLNISTRSSGAPTDSILSNSAVEIRIYP